jgi:tetratricopeptide (TPR) repeat protein
MARRLASLSLASVLLSAACGGAPPTAGPSTFVPGDEDRLFQQALQERRERNAPAAEASLRRALQANPRYLAAHLELGDLLLDLERWTDAEATFLQAVALRDRTPDGHLGLARATFPQGRTAEAMVHAERAVTTALQAQSTILQAEARIILAEIALHQGDLALASESLDAALQADSTNTRARLIRARIRAREGDVTGAVQLLARAESFETDPQLLREIGALYYELRLDDRAMEALQRSREVEPDHEDTLYWLSAAQLRSGQRDVAIQNATTLIRRNPAYLNAYVVRGQGELARGYLDRAGQDAAVVLQQQPGHPGALLLEADIARAAWEALPESDARRASAQQEAEQRFRQALAADPDAMAPAEHAADFAFAARQHALLVEIVSPRLQRQGAPPSWRDRLAQAWIALDDLQQGLPLASEVALTQPTNAQANAAVARLAMANPGILNEATLIQHASFAYQNSDRSLDFILLIVDAHLADRNCTQADNFLEPAVRAFPSNPLVRQRQDTIRRCVRAR